MNNTPRTDEERKLLQRDIWTGKQFTTNEMVRADFARQLERELANMTDQRDAALETIRRIKLNQDQNHESTIRHTRKQKPETPLDGEARSEDASV